MFSLVSLTVGFLSGDEGLSHTLHCTLRCRRVQGGIQAADCWVPLPPVQLYFACPARMIRQSLNLSSVPCPWVSSCGRFCLQNVLNLNDVSACITYSRPERAQEPIYQISNALFGVFSGEKTFLKNSFQKGVGEMMSGNLIVC